MRARRSRPGLGVALLAGISTRAGPVTDRAGVEARLPDRCGRDGRLMRRFGQGPEFHDFAQPTATGTD
jgi:hypothetical protein